MKRSKVIATAVALSFLLVGCSGDESDQQPSAAVSSAEASMENSSGSSEETEGEAEEPDDDGVYQPATETSPAKNVPLPHFDERIHELTEEGMYAAAKYFFDAQNYAIETSKPDALEKIVTASCQTCFHYQQLMNDLRSENIWTLSGKITDYDFESDITPDIQDNYRVNYQYTETPIIRIVDGKKHEVGKTHMIGAGTLWLAYSSNDKQWFVLENLTTKSEPKEQ